MPTQNLGVISVNIWSIIISLLNLVIIFLILKRFLFKPIKSIISQRNSEIDEAYAASEKALNDAEAAKAMYDSKLINANEDAEKIIRQANEKAGKLQKELIDEANAKAELTLRRAEEQIAFEKKKADNEIKAQIAEVSVILAEKLVDREINADDHTEMINDFIDNVRR